jgi:2-amino-4-hydroxy-6-hydroxymethyldihydropteridine diphosphokinase
MILIGLGGNLPSARFGPPAATLDAALARMAEHGVRVVRRSRWYFTAPVPNDGAPWYTNGVAYLETDFQPHDLLFLLLRTEREMGRVRSTRNAPRLVDLDLLAYDNYNTWNDPPPAIPPHLPHPRLHERAFVLFPLAEVAPGWRHPALGRSVAELIADLPPGQQITALA